MEQEKKTYKPINRVERIDKAELSQETREIIILKAQLKDVIDNMYKYLDCYYSSSKDTDDKIGKCHIGLEDILDEFLISSITNNLDDGKI